MPAKKYIVELDAGERELLTGFISTGKASAKAILKARILLKADEADGGPGWLDSQIVEALDTNPVSYDLGASVDGHDRRSRVNLEGR